MVKQLSWGHSFMRLEPWKTTSIVVSVPPSLALSEFVAQLKGSSSHFANHKLEQPSPFKWQAEFGVVSFDGKQLDRIVQYVHGQQKHHQGGTLIPILEKMSGNEQQPRKK